VTPTNDCARFEAAYRAHYPAIVRFLRRRSDPDTADELAAETFAVAWRRLDAMPADALPWLLVVARNHLSNHRRAEASRREKAASSGFLAEPSARDPAEALGERELVLRAFRRLGERDREALRLVAWDGLSQAQAARVLGTTRLAFAARFGRARRRLQKHLDDLERGPAVQPRPREVPS
jgi:RNA polymerase sigma factor (sigma-70 family)